MLADVVWRSEALVGGARGVLAGLDLCGEVNHILSLTLLLKHRQSSGSEHMRVEVDVFHVDGRAGGGGSRQSGPVVIRQLHIEGECGLRGHTWVGKGLIVW